MKFGFIGSTEGYGQCCGCARRSVSAGCFYAWLTRPRSQRSRDDDELGAKVRASFLGSDRTWARRVWRDLLTEGISCGSHRIERLTRRRRSRHVHAGAACRPIGGAQRASSHQRSGPQLKPPLQPQWIADSRMAGPRRLVLCRAVIDPVLQAWVGWSMSAGMTAQLVTDDS